MAARWDIEETNWELNTYPNAPCHTCMHRDKENIGNVKGGAKYSCLKYPIPRYSVGCIGKPTEILKGIFPCKYYQKG